MTRHARSPFPAARDLENMYASEALAILRRQTQAERQGPCWAHVCRMGREDPGRLLACLRSSS